MVVDSKEEGFVEINLDISSELELEGLAREMTRAIQSMRKKKGLKVLLLDKPWNRKIRHGNVYRCQDWRDILNEVERLEGGV